MTGSIIRVLGWLVRHSHDEHHDEDGDSVRGMVVAARNEHDAMKAEIARLKAEVAALRVDHERAIGTLTVSGVALDVHSTMSMTTHVESVVSQVRGLLRENQALRLDLAAHKRALAAGPAALRRKLPVDELPGVWDLIADAVEAAQEAAMKEGT